jgi:hypothetical protein
MFGWLTGANRKRRMFDETLSVACVVPSVCATASVPARINHALGYVIFVILIVRAQRAISVTISNVVITIICKSWNCTRCVLMGRVSTFRTPLLSKSSPPVQTNRQCE